MIVQTILSTVIIALLSFSGAVFLFFQKDIVQKISLFLVALAAGGFIGTAFLHLLPEALEEAEGVNLFLFPIAGFFLFLVSEQLLHWHHSHRQANHPHQKGHLGILNLLGDGVHNFLDGVIIAIAFLADPGLGLVTAAAVALHEIPQEIAEFGVLIYAGFSRARALLLNFLSASTVVLGGIAGLALGGLVEPYLASLLLFVAGIFLYVGASDFVPEIRKEGRMLQSLSLSLTFAAGIFLMWVFTFLE